MKKRVGALLLALLMVLTILPSGALAEDFSEVPQTPEQAQQTAEEPQEAPAPPQATAEQPGTPEQPQATPEDPQATPEQPQATPEDPQATPEQPQATPEQPPEAPEEPQDEPAVTEVPVQNDAGEEDPDAGIALLSLEDEPMTVASAQTFDVSVDGVQVKPGGRIDFDTLLKGTAAEKTLVFKNVSGKQAIMHVTSLPDLLTATSNGETVTKNTSFTCEPDGQFEITFTTRTNLNPGTYNRNVFLGLCNTDRGRDFYPFYFDFIVAGTKLTVTPELSEKPYGQQLTPENVPVTITNESGDKVPDSLASLGYRLACSGFSATASAGKSYLYTLESVGSPELYAELNGSPALTVVKVKPETQSLQAFSIHVGETLNEHKPFYIFTNPNNPSMEINGSFDWVSPDPDTALEEPGPIEAHWKFTPADTVNYEAQTGTVTVTVTNRTPTELTHKDATHTDTGVAHTVTYDGQPHGVVNKEEGWTYTSNRTKEDGTPDESTPITVSYRLMRGADGIELAEPRALGPNEYPTDAGTYELTVSIAAAGKYAAATLTDMLTIEPRPIEYYAELGSRRYDGTTDVNATYFTIPNKVKGDDVNVTYTAKLTSPNVNNQAPVTFTLTGLTGSDAANYRLPDDPVSTRYVSIFLRKLSVAPKNFEKKYGELLFLSAGDFAITGLVEGEAAGLDFISSGEPATAPVSGSPYSITAELTDTNYTFGDSMTHRVPELPNCGTITVAQAKPQINGELSIGSGKNGKTLGSVSLAGGFVNENNTEMAVPGTLAWADPDQLLPAEGSTCTAHWVFTPSDANYTKLEGDAEIELIADQPVLITVQEPTVVDYDGREHALTVTTEPKTDVTVEYFLEPAMETSVQAPRDAGTYYARITAARPTEPEGYTGSELTAQLTISPVAPNVVPKELGIDQTTEMTAQQGTLLKDLQAEYGFDNGFKFTNEFVNEDVKGTFSWAVSAGSDGTVNADEQEFVWSFTPESGNFTVVGGIVKFELAKDTRTVTGTVYNLPEAEGIYKDYAVIDIAGSGLKPGETVTLFKDAQCLMPASGTVTVPEEGTNELTIEINDNVLSPKGDTSYPRLYARITSSTKHEGTQLHYGPEPDFDLLVNGAVQTGAIVVHMSGDGKMVTVQPGGGGTCIPEETSFILTYGGSVEYVTMQNGTDSLSKLLHGTKDAGDDATLTVTVTFEELYNGKNVTVTKVFPVTCPGLLDLDVSTQGNAPNVTLDMNSDEIHKAVYDSDRDNEDLKSKEVDYILHVAEGVDPTSQNQIDDKLNSESKGYIVGQYFDITLTREVDHKKTDDITETAKPLRITIPIDKNAWGIAANITEYSQFVVVRVHKYTDGHTETEILDDKDTNPDTITIETKLFSAYAIAYRTPTGSLTVTKSVTGKGDKNRKFEFTVILNGVASASFPLSDGGSETIKDLPVGVTYQVIETEANLDGYTTTATNASGTVQEGTINVTFVNDIPVPAPGKPSEPAKGPNNNTGANTGTEADEDTDTVKPARPAVTVPQTSDDSHLALWVCLLGLSVLGLAVTALLYWKRRKTYGKHK